MKYSVWVGLRKAIYVAMMMLSVAVTAMVKTGQFSGPSDLTWPLVLTGVAVAADWLRNYIKVADPDTGKTLSKLPIVVLAAVLACVLEGCAVSTTRFHESSAAGTPDELITDYSGWSWTPPLSKRESANLVWSYKLDGGKSEISTGQEDKGVDTTGQQAAFEMLGRFVSEAVTAWAKAELAQGATPVDLVHDVVPLLAPSGSGK